MPTKTLWDEFAEMQDELDRLFRISFGDGVSYQYPPVNIAENDDSYVVEARVPGLSKDDISIELDGRQLRLRGEHKRVEATYLRSERVDGRFERVLTFLHDLDPEKVEAVVENGILRVTLPKAESAKPRRIAINTK
ncbi:MAG: Hsp20/alpha crystallin family protein [Turneriella sp.]|nr:Hsp20/alpha crystallin family protein [Turneriella sp.]